MDNVTRGTAEEGFPDNFHAAVKEYAEQKHITLTAAYEEVDNDTIDPNDPLNPDIFLGARIGPKPLLIHCELCGFQGYNQSLFLNTISSHYIHIYVIKITIEFKTI